MLFYFSSWDYNYLDFTVEVIPDDLKIRLDEMLNDLDSLLGYV